MEERVLGRDNKEGDVIATAMRAPHRAWACSKEERASTELALSSFILCLLTDTTDR